MERYHATSVQSCLSTRVEAQMAKRGECGIGEREHGGDPRSKMNACVVVVVSASAVTE
jgi:hypothetical protein